MILVRTDSMSRVLDSDIKSSRALTLIVAWLSGFVGYLQRGNSRILDITAIFSFDSAGRRNDEFFCKSGILCDFCGYTRQR